MAAAALLPVALADAPKIAGALFLPGSAARMAVIAAKHKPISPIKRKLKGRFSLALGVLLLLKRFKKNSITTENDTIIL